MRLEAIRIALPALTVLCALVARGDEFAPTTPPPTSEFHFTRLAYPDLYSGYSSFGRRGGSWQVDWPDAEYHFLQGVSRLTRVDTSPDARIVQLSDDEIFDYPWLYAVEVGHWYLDETNAARLREYLLRGGFLMVDDFHGTVEWANFLDSMTRVFPDRPILEIPEDDEVLHVVYDLNERVQIPGIRALMMGRTYERDGVTPHWRGIYDDAGRLIVAINHNMDMGDAWEHADNPQYPENMTALAYRFAGNYVVYAMTH
jgi:Domain of unknown function (DUF4159)